MSDPTTPAAPQEPTPAAAGTAPEAPVTPQPAAAEPAAPAVASDPQHAAQNQAPAANPYVAPGANAYAAPAAGYAPAAPVKQTLSLVSFIVGLISVLLSFAYGIGLIPGIVAVILGFQGKKKEPAAPKWMWLTGVITGFVAIGLGLIVGLVTIIGVIIYFAALSSLTSFS